MVILCDPKVLRQFRKECRERYPLEHLAAVIGHHSTEGNILITRLADIQHEAEKNSISWRRSDVVKSKKQALNKDEEWLGTIHSHCHTVSDPTCEHLSDVDIRTAMRFGESICGLVYVYAGGERTDVRWYVPHPLPKIIKNPVIIAEAMQGILRS